MKNLARVLLAGTMMSGAVAFGSSAFAESTPFVLAQAEVPPPAPGAAPPEGQPKKREEKQQQRQEKQQPRQEQQQQRQNQRQEQQQQRQDQRQEQQQQRQQQRQEQIQQRQEQQQQRQEQRQQQIEQRQQQRQAPPAAPPVEKQAPPPVEKQAPPPAAAPTPAPVEKQTPPPAAAPTPPPPAAEPPADRKQQREERQQQREDRQQQREERQQQRQMQKDGTPPVPPVPPRTQAPVTPDTATPPVPPAAGKQAPPAASQTAPAAPSVAPAPPPAGEQPAIPPEELKSGQRTPEQRERAEQRAKREFQQRDEKLDRRFDRRVEEQGDRTIIREGKDRVIIRDGDRTIIRSDETERLRRNARDVREERRGNQTVTVIQRPNGVEIVTIRDQDGNLVRRLRREGGREIVIIDNERAWERGGRWDRDRGWRDRDRDRGPHFEFYLDLAPVPVRIPREEYIVDADTASYEEFEETFEAPPLVETERPYSLQEVTQNVRLRERVRSIDLNSLNFPTGEWTVPDDQIPKLEDLANAMKAVIDRDPTQVYLVEGHTDAIGSQVDNLSLSDRRAEEVAAILTEHYEIPAENIVTQGYGEDYLKVNTLAANEENRRVTIRNITSLLNAQQSQAAPQ